MKTTVKKGICMLLVCWFALSALIGCTSPQTTIGTGASSQVPSYEKESLENQTPASEADSSLPSSMEASKNAAPSSSAAVNSPTPPSASVVPSPEPTPTPDLTPTPEPTPTPTPEPPVEETPWILKETADAGTAYQDQLIFLGDSTTAHMITHGVLTDGKNTKQVWKGAVGNTITFAYMQTAKILYPDTGEQMLIIDAVKKAQPKYLVITLGVTGGVSMKLKEDAFKKLYRWLLDEIYEVSPNTTVIAQSIYPTCKETQYTSITNPGIMQANSWICDLAKEYYQKGRTVYYADTYSALVDSTGYLPAKYGNGDGLHLNAKAYAVILEYLRTHAVTLQ